MTIADYLKTRLQRGLTFISLGLNEARLLKEETGRGFPGFINLLGMESPGLTGALAIGEYVFGMLQPAG